MARVDLIGQHRRRDDAERRRRTRAALLGHPSEAPRPARGAPLRRRAAASTCDARHAVACRYWGAADGEPAISVATAEGTPLVADPLDQDRYAEIARSLHALGESDATLVGGDGRRVALPAPLLRVLREAATALAGDRAVDVVPIPRHIILPQTARLLEMPRDYLETLLDEEALSASGRGARRRRGLRRATRPAAARTPGADRPTRSGDRGRHRDSRTLSVPWCPVKQSMAGHPRARSGGEPFSLTVGARGHAPVAGGSGRQAEGEGGGASARQTFDGVRFRRPRYLRALPRGLTGHPPGVCRKRFGRTAVDGGHPRRTSPEPDPRPAPGGRQG